MNFKLNENLKKSGKKVVDYGLYPIAYASLLIWEIREKTLGKFYELADVPYKTEEGFLGKKYKRVTSSET